jgi:TM2 domain-containing membrane protein YozV
LGTYIPTRPTKHCHACGSVIDAMAVECPPCGVMQLSPTMEDESEKRILPAALLCFFFGVFGVHRFYVGKRGTGVLQLLTLGGLGIWTMIDFIMIVVGAFRDGDDNKIVEWT